MSNEELVELHQNGDTKALDKLIDMNMGIIYKLAKKYNGINKVMELEDLVQDGVMGLMKAAEIYNLYNENRAKFITYAIYYINRYILNSVNGRSGKQEGNNKFHANCTSLNIPVGQDGETTELGNLIEDIDYGFENIEERIYLKQLREQLEGSMSQYNTLEEREILKLRYGWNFKPMTLDEVGEVFNITGSRVRQKESMALRKLRTSIWGRINAKEFYKYGYIEGSYIRISKDIKIKC